MTAASPDRPGPAGPDTDPAGPDTDPAGPDTDPAADADVDAAMSSPPRDDAGVDAVASGREVRPPPVEAPDVDLLPDRTSDEIDHDRAGEDDEADRRLWEDRPPHWDA